MAYPSDTCVIEHRADRITITATDGRRLVIGDKVTDAVEVHVIDYEMPLVGRTYSIDGRAVEVNAWRFDQAGTCWVEDATTKAWHRWHRG